MTSKNNREIDGKPDYLKSQIVTSNKEVFKVEFVTLNKGVEPIGSICLTLSQSQE